MTLFLFVRHLSCHVVIISCFFFLYYFIYIYAYRYVYKVKTASYFFSKNSNVFRGECVSLTGLLSPRPGARFPLEVGRRDVGLSSVRNDFSEMGAPFRILPYTSVCTDTHASRREAKIHRLCVTGHCDIQTCFCLELRDHGCAGC